MTDIVEELRAECLAHHRISAQAGGPGGEERHALEGDLRWRAAVEIEQLRRALDAVWQPMANAPKDQRILLYCPRLAGNVAQEVVVGMWRFDPNRRSLGYWVSDVGKLDGGFAETGPWIEYPELKPERWAPLLACPLSES